MLLDRIAEAEGVKPRKRMQRLAKELTSLSNDLPINRSSSVFVRADEDHLECWQMLITGRSCSICPQVQPCGCADHNVLVHPQISRTSTDAHETRFCACTPTVVTVRSHALSRSTYLRRVWSPVQFCFVQNLSILRNVFLGPDHSSCAGRKAED